MAEPSRDVYVMLGDGSYLMLNSELATSVVLARKLIVTVLDNRGFACINRLQRASGGAAFNNLWADSHFETLAEIDFAAHAASLGAIAEKVSTIVELEQALKRAKFSDRTHVIVIQTDPAITTEAGGAWWDVAIPEVSARPQVRAAREAYVDQLKKRTGDWT
jgi:3D-(3,5/4)-trihydroxycyclohexane-1,2-dione acylhydrolase (decyclizing)